jgi:methyl-accepting chemotaxis protein
MNLTRDLEQAFSTAETYINAQHEIVRKQSAEDQYTKRELTQKELVNVKFRQLLKSLKDKEFKSMYIKQLNTERGIMEFQ